MFLGGCAPITHDARAVARAEHARREPPPQPPPEPAKKHPPLVSWSLDDLTAVEGEAVELRHADRPVAILSLSALRALRKATSRIGAVVSSDQSTLQPIFRIVEGFPANAHVISSPTHPVVAVNVAMVHLLDDDEALWAALIGHELAHVEYGHRQKRTERADWGAKAGGVVTVLLGFMGVPLASVLMDSAATLVTLGYSREDELEADAAAVTYLRRAGYDPEAAMRFHQRLVEHTDNRSGNLLSTHPGGKERIDAIRRVLESPPS